MTERLYYTDARLVHFDATVLSVDDDGRRVRLDRTAFYPTSGGQPFDRGTLGDVQVVDVIDEDDAIVHLLERSLDAGPGSTVAGRVDWTRRFDHMQQHTGQHLLSALLADRLGWNTVSVHFGDEYSTVDVKPPAGDGSAVASDGIDAWSARLAEIEADANRIIAENRDVDVSFVDADSVTGLRKPSSRSGTLRIVTIDGVDRSACGGTHVSRTGEIGGMLLRRVERTKGTLRIEFLCGQRAVRGARADYLVLQQASRILSASPAEVPALLEAQLHRIRELEREQRRLATDLAAFEARVYWEGAPPAADGVRRLHLTCESGHARERQLLATSICALGGAVVLVTSRDTPSILLATSADAGVDAVQLLKSLIGQHGGKGGGSPRVAQASLSTDAPFDVIIETVLHGAH